MSDLEKIKKDLAAFDERYEDYIDLLVNVHSHTSALMEIVEEQQKTIREIQAAAKELGDALKDFFEESAGPELYRAMSKFVKAAEELPANSDNSDQSSHI